MMSGIGEGCAFLLSCYAVFADAKTSVRVDEDSISEFGVDETVKAIFPNVPKACMEKRLGDASDECVGLGVESGTIQNRNVPLYGGGEDDLSIMHETVTSIGDLGGEPIRTSGSRNGE